MKRLRSLGVTEQVSLAKRRQRFAMASARSTSSCGRSIVFVLLFCVSLIRGEQCPFSPMTVSTNSFGAQIVEKLGDKGNYFVSPLSISTALAMTYLGAGGHTAEQMEEAFQLKRTGFDRQNFHQLFGEILDVYQRPNDQYTLMVANGMFVQKGYTVREGYLRGLMNYYRATFKALDFMTAGQEAKEEINHWVSTNTENMIDQLLSEPLDPATRLALLNAVYFKGTWKVQFNKETTYDGLFFLDRRTTKPVKFMHLHKEKFPYYEDPDSGYTFLEMPYKGEDISMLFVLPETGSYRPKLQMTSHQLCSIRERLQVKEIDWVKIPKFRLEYSKELKEALNAVGIEDLFTTEADLTGISESGNLQVSSVLHKAVIDVNEEGSEAAAVTGVIIEDRMGAFDKPEFVANRPFLFYIIDKRSGLVLFSGRLSDP